MAGRGAIAPEDKVPHPRVLMLDRSGNWVPAVDPVHFDKPFAGVGPGRRFAILLAESDPSITVGLIPAACGGSPLSTLTAGIHIHTLLCPDEASYERCVHDLREAGLLLD